MPTSRRFPSTRRIAVACASVLLSTSVTQMACLGAGASPARDEGARPRVVVERATPLPDGAVSLGAVRASTPITLDVALEPRDPAALASFVASISTPGDAAYRHYLSRGTFGARFGATRTSLRAVLAALRGDGIGSLHVAADRLLVEGRTTAARAESTFATTIDAVRLTGGATRYAAITAATLPAAIAPDVEGVFGLSDVGRLASSGGARPASSALEHGIATSVAHASGPAPCRAAALTGAATSNVLADAYGLRGLYARGDLGAGETIALFEVAGFSPHDVATYQACYRTHASVAIVRTDGGAGIGSGTLEATSDVEDLIGLAPRASIRVYETGNVFTPDWLDQWTRIVDADDASVISTSWLQCEADEPGGLAAAENTTFEQAAAQGETVLAATGDFGSESCRQSSGSTALAVDDPASTPYALAVGGTQWSSVTPRAGERAWNESGVGAGGGGISSNWPMPSWQQGRGVVDRYSSGAPCHDATGSCRETPDVSALSGTPYYAFYCSAGDCGSVGGWGYFYGTSFATPLWAASVALANESCAGEPPMGFVAPTLYELADASTSPFHDLTVGETDYTGSHHGDYPAGPGYDLATGLGAPAWTTGTAAPGLAGQLCGLAQAQPLQATSTVPAPSDAVGDPDASLDAVACPPGGRCVAVGSYATAGGTNAMTASELGGAWDHVVEVLAPSNAAGNPGATLSGVACVAPGSCVGAGHYLDGSGQTEAMAAIETDGAFGRAVEVQAPTGAAGDPDATLDAVACPTAITCTAVGSYVDATGQTEAMAATEREGAWARAVEVDTPTGAASDPGSTLLGIACPTPTGCTAVGSYLDGSGHTQSMAVGATSGTFGRASAVTAPLGAASDPDARLDAVACAPSGTCVAVGSFASPSGTDALAVAEATGGTWGRGVEVTAPSGAPPDPAATLDGAVCPAEGRCLAVGSYADGSATDAMTTGESEGTWSRATGLAPPKGAAHDPGATLHAVACSALRTCVGVGTYSATGADVEAMSAGAATPVVTKVTPSTGTTSGGALVTIIGRALAASPLVRFGNARAVLRAVLSANELEVQAPRGAGVVEVTVTTSGGTSAASSVSRYTYAPPPTLTRLSPARGPSRGGTVVTLTGAHLSDVVAVHFGSARAAITRQVSSSELLVVAPRGTGVVEVTVTTSAARSVATRLDRYTYVGP